MPNRIYRHKHTYVEVLPSGVNRGQELLAHINARDRLRTELDHAGPRESADCQKRFEVQVLGQDQLTTTMRMVQYQPIASVRLPDLDPEEP